MRLTDQGVGRAVFCASIWTIWLKVRIGEGLNTGGNSSRSFATTVSLPVHRQLPRGRCYRGIVDAARLEFTGTPE